MPHPIVIALVLAIVCVLIGAQWGYNGGVRETERRWHDAAGHSEHYWHGVQQRANDQILSLQTELHRLRTKYEPPVLDQR